MKEFFGCYCWRFWQWSVRSIRILGTEIGTLRPLFFFSFLFFSHLSLFSLFVFVGMFQWHTLPWQHLLNHLSPFGNLVYLKGSDSGGQAFADYDITKWSFLFSFSSSYHPWMCGVDDYLATSCTFPFLKDNLM